MEELIGTLEKNDFVKLLFDDIKNGKNDVLKVVLRISKKFKLTAHDHNKIKKICKMNAIQPNTEYSTRTARKNPLVSLKESLSETEIEVFPVVEENTDIFKLLKQDLLISTQSILIRCNIGNLILEKISSEKLLKIYVGIYMRLINQDQSLH